MLCSTWRYVQFLSPFFSSAAHFLPFSCTSLLPSLRTTCSTILQLILKVGSAWKTHLLRLHIKPRLCLFMVQGERLQSHRLLRVVKNRYGSTDEVFFLSTLYTYLRVCHDHVSLHISFLESFGFHTRVSVSVWSTLALLVSSKKCHCIDSMQAQRSYVLSKDSNSNQINSRHGMAWVIGVASICICKV